jgi:hypothetical protein
MKKTIVALAVLAASGASFAQNVSMTGTLAYGYQALSTNGVEASGFGNDTSDVYLDASEDLGGGMKIAAAFGVTGLVKGGAVAGTDSTLTLTTGAGTFKTGLTKGGDYLSGGISGLGGYGLDGRIYTARSVKDFVSFTLPSMSGLTLGLTFTEGSAANGTAAGVSGVAATVGQPTTSISATYAAGALASNLNYVSYANRTAASEASVTSVTRGALSYDLGVVKLGVGASVVLANGTNNNTTTDSIFSLAAPVGPLTVVGQFGQRTTANSTTTAWNATITGAIVKATYPLSKRTYMTATYGQWTGATSTTDPTPHANKSSMTEFVLGHSF